MKAVKRMIAPSILSADFAQLGAEVKAVLQAGADMIHIDAMDNHYVPNLSFGPVVCKALRKYGITAPLDVHIMAKPVDSLIIEFARAGATYISFHPEASEHIDRSINLITEHGCKAGLVFNPATPLHELEYLWDKLDLITLMSVNPGFGGQHFIDTMWSKIEQTYHLIKLNRPEILLEIDGGVTLDNCQRLWELGANVLVMGSAIFSHPGNYQLIINQAKTLAEHLGEKSS